MNARESSDLLARIRSEFPNFKFKRVSKIRSGENHTALILDNTWVFRFPKSEAYRLAFPRQVKLLNLLAPLTSLRVPVYTYVSDDLSFGGYQIVRGTGLTARKFSRLPHKSKEKAIRDLAFFLKTLHSMPTSSLDEPKPEEGYWDPDHVWKYAERYRKTRRSLIKKFVPSHLLEQIDSFFPEFEGLHAPQKRITHGDLRDAHILFEKGRVTGIIDFSDAYVADPAYDFACFWSWGHDWFYKLIEAYGMGDPKLPERSFWHYLRAEIDNLYYALRDGDNVNAERIMKILEKHLPNLLGSDR